MAYPSDLARTKNWGAEILYSADLKAQIDLVINWVMALANNSSGHKHTGGANDAPPISPATGLVIASQAQGDILYATSASVWARLAKGTASQVLTMNAGATAPEWKTATAPTVYPPTGTIAMWGGAIASPPDGWLICDGSAVSQETYADLYAVIGTIYGADTGGNFTLPKFTNRFPYGASEGSSAGNASVGKARDRAELTGNDDSVTCPQANSQVANPGSGNQANISCDIMPSYLAVSFIIKT
jgi:hypothetical protein